MDEVRQFIDNDRFAEYLGIDILEYGQGRAKGRMEIKSHHLNSAGTLHGGVIFTFADVVFSSACNSHGTLAVAINVSISYFKAVRSGVVTAEAEEISLGPKLATYLISVRDESGDVIALFQGTAYRKTERLPGAGS